MLDQREITKLKKNGWIDKPKYWPQKVLIYAVLPEYQANIWVPSTRLHSWLLQLCQFLKRPPISKRAMLNRLKTMAEKGWIDLDKRTETHETNSPAGRGGHSIYYIKRRDMDYHGNLVWPEWLPEMQVRGVYEPEERDDDG